MRLRRATTAVAAASALVTAALPVAPAAADEDVPIAFATTVNGDPADVYAPAAAQGTYEAIQAPPKMLVSVTGANHYGITDTQDPPGAAPDPSAQTVPQETGIKASARWSTMFLRTVLGDAWSGVWLWGVGDAVDPAVTVQHVR